MNQWANQLSRSHTRVTWLTERSRDLAIWKGSIVPISKSSRAIEHRVAGYLFAIFNDRATFARSTATINYCIIDNANRNCENITKFVVTTETLRMLVSKIVKLKLCYVFRTSETGYNGVYPADVMSVKWRGKFENATVKRERKRE